MTHSVVLVGRGIDSATNFAVACEQSDEVTPVHFTYADQSASVRENIRNQRAKREMVHGATKVNPVEVVNYAGVFSNLSPEGYSTDQTPQIPNWVPMRNLHFISTAVSVGQRDGADAIYVGYSKEDDEQYPGGREEAIGRMQELIETSIDGEIELYTPLARLSSPRIVQMAKRHRVPFEYAYRCYDGLDGEPCGECDDCARRSETFAEAGVEDPLNPTL